MKKRAQKISARKIGDRRWLKFAWLENRGFTFQRLLVHQGLQNFCEFHHAVYTGAVKEFYANFTKNSFGYQSMVNGVHFIIKPEDFRLLYGIRNFGLCLSNDDDPDEEPDDIDVEPNSVYLETLTDISTAGKSGRFIGNMKLDDRLLFWTMTHILTPKSGNYGYPTDVDLKYIYAIKHHMDINWVKIIFHHMLRISKSLSGTGKLPYSMMVSQILTMKNVPLNENDRIVDLEKTCCLNSRVLKNSEIVKHPTRGWMTRLDFVAVCKEESEAKKRKKTASSSDKGKAPMESDAEDFDVQTALKDMEARLVDHIDDRFAALRADLGFS